MSNTVDRVNTIKVEFCSTCAQPSNHELILFALSLELQQKDLHSLYYDTMEKCVYIKVHSPNVKHEILLKFPKKTFHYNNGITTPVHLTSASYNRSAIQHVQVFNLPPEVDNATVRVAFEEYGIVEHVEREKIDTPLKINVLNGVRRIRMNIKKVIPPVMWIKGCPVTVGYWSPKSEAASQSTLEVDDRVVERKKSNRPNSAPVLDCIPEDDTTLAAKAKPKKTTNFKDFYSQKAKN